TIEERSVARVDGVLQVDRRLEVRVLREDLADQRLRLRVFLTVLGVQRAAVDQHRAGIELVAFELLLLVHREWLGVLLGLRGGCRRLALLNGSGIRAGARGASAARAGLHI